MRQLFHLGFETRQEFLSNDTCDEILAEANGLDINKIDLKVDVSQTETRIWQAEKCLSSVEKILSAEFLKPYEKLFNQKFSFCIYNEVSPGSTGSGGGWHRDTRFKDQYKILIYLSDCRGHEEGCFRYISRSHTKLNVFRLLTLVELFRKPRFKALSPILNFFGKDIGGKKGDAILVNSTGIHRGNPVARGKRRALTLYFDNGVKFD